MRLVGIWIVTLALFIGPSHADQRSCRKQGDDCPCVKVCLAEADKCDPKIIKPLGQECSDKLMSCVRACGIK